MKQKFLTIMILAMIIFTGCDTYESNLGKSRTVVIFYLGEDYEVIDYTGKKEINWNKIVKEE